MLVIKRLASLLLSLKRRKGKPVSFLTIFRIFLQKIHIDER
ncbi:hypothetical protein B4168_1818 [Anoxybacillus flavithermus]|nr:hypothetical protein B4168_1818 [Anoxybacillus flavithermus]OAO85473.1 hypothetical protein GT23_2376 [Parageobacillus thermoglucosidasius]